MATYYVINGSASIDDGAGGYIIAPGANANNGTTPLTPKKNLSSLLGSVTPTVSDTVYIAGIQVGSFTCVARIVQWPDQSQAYTVGSVAPTDDSGLTWSLNVDTWSVTIGTNKVLGTYDPDAGGVLTSIDHGNVVAKWLSRVDSYGRHYGWYKWGSLSGGRLTANKRVFYDQASGVLYIRDDSLFTGGVTPNTLTGMDAVRYVTGDTYQIGVDQRTSSTCRGISGIIGGHYCTRADNTNSVPPSYGYIGGGDVIVENCEFWDCEVHGIVFSNDPNTNCRGSNVKVWGGGTYNGYSAIVTHNGGATVASDVTGTRVTGFNVFPYGLLDPDGVPHDATVGLNALYAHTKGVGGGTIDDVEFANGVIRFVENKGSAFNAADTNSTISNVDSYDAFPFRVKNVIVYGQKTTSYIQGNVALRRVFTDSTACALQASLDVTAVIFAVGAGFTCLMDACVHVTNTDIPSGTDDRIIYKIYTGSCLSQINCTTIDVATSSTLRNHSMFQYGSAALYVAGSAGFQNRAKGCIFYFKTAFAGNYFAYFDGGVANTGNYVFDGNWITNIPAGHWAENTSYDTLAEWQAVIDTHSDATTTPAFVTDTSVDPLVAGKPTTGGNIFTNKYTTAVHTSLGYNSQGYGGMRGAWQYPANISKKINLLFDNRPGEIQ